MKTHYHCTLSWLVASTKMIYGHVVLPLEQKMLSTRDLFLELKSSNRKTEVFKISM